MVHLVSVLSNFEPIQLRIEAAARTKRREPRLTRADLRRRIRVRDQQLIKRYEAGETVKRLAREFGMNHSTIRALLVEAGVTVRTRRRLSVEQIARAHDLYLDGYSTTQIAELFGCYASTIGRALVKLGVSLRPPGKAS